LSRPRKLEASSPIESIITPKPAPVTPIPAKLDPPRARRNPTAEGRSSYCQEQSPTAKLGRQSRADRRQRRLNAGAESGRFPAVIRHCAFGPETRATHRTAPALLCGGRYRRGRAQRRPQGRLNPRNSTNSPSHRNRHLFLFTDIEGSTRILRALGEQIYGAVTRRRHERSDQSRSSPRSLSGSPMMSIATIRPLATVNAATSNRAGNLTTSPGAPLTIAGSTRPAKAG
jgi:hypothetical protein